MILVDGEHLLGILEELEAYEVFAQYFDDISLQTDTGDDSAGKEDAGVVDRLRGWFG